MHFIQIGIINAFSQKDKNALLYSCTKAAADKCGAEVINFGCFAEETENFSYIEIAVEASMLLTSGSVDFIVTGCSSGQGMMLACNSLPGILCGYAPTPQDAFLFGRINDGNAVSLPLGLNFGWAGEINLQCTLQKLFEEPFGTGYPPQDAERKKKDALLLKELNALTKRSAAEVYSALDKVLIAKALSRKNIYDYIIQNGRNTDIVGFLKTYRQSR